MPWRVASLVCALAASAAFADERLRYDGKTALQWTKVALSTSEQRLLALYKEKDPLVRSYLLALLSDLEPDNAVAVAERLKQIEKKFNPRCSLRGSGRGSVSERFIPCSPAGRG